MALTLMYITNRPEVALIAQEAGVDRIWVDMEYIGKSERQGGMDTVQNHHTIEDIKRIRPLIKSSALMVRVNPLHEATEEYSDSKQEISDAIEAGADVIMLPMFRTADDVQKFIDYVDGRAKTQLLVETAEAVKNIDSIMEVPGIDEIHIGLNDLHLAFHQKFMFELLCDGTVAGLCKKIRDKGIKYGFGGVARVGYGMLPAEYIIAEHYHLESTAAILSRGFCDANKVSDANSVKEIFIDGIKKIREQENVVARFTEEEYLKNLDIIKLKVNEIIRR